LKDIIEGNAKTLLFLNVSPFEKDFENSKKTIHFGASIKRLKSKPVKNVQSKEVTCLKEEVQHLRGLLEQKAIKT